MEKDSYQVLHCHTKLSDGTLSHREVLDKCYDNNIEVVAFTDHDILMTDKIIGKLKKLNHPVRFISGIELSATGIAEVEGGIPLFHIIGLFVDHTNKALQEFCADARKRRRERVVFLVNNLTKAGFSITEEEVEKESSEGTIGRPHIVSALLKKEENIKVLNATLEQFKQAAERDIALKERYEEATRHDARSQVFDLFLGGTPFVPGVYTPYLHETTMDKGVKLIRDAGGISVLAHPSYYRDKLGANIIEKFAKENRIDGIETVYALSPDGKLNDDFRSDTDSFRDIVNRYQLVAGGGGDFHTPEDFEKLNIPLNIERMQETKGFLDRIFIKWPEYRDKIY